MSTTSLLLEILIIGTTADVWVVLILLAAFSPSATEFAAVVETVSKLSTFLVVPFLAFTYLLGWIINFICEHTIEPLFQTKYKNQLFSHEKLNYEHVRALFFQEASESVISDLNFDRQLIDISRASVLNFLLISVSLLLHLKFNPLGIIVGTAISVIISVLTFLQWTVTYKMAYRKILNTYRVIIQGEIKTPKQKPKKEK